MPIQNSLKSLLSTARGPGASGRFRCGKRSSFRPLLEALEDRMLLSTIMWTNRGNANNDSDGFNSAFGANAAAARNVVDYTLLTWQSVIDSFNYSDAALNDTYRMTVNMQTSGVSLGASAGPTKVLNGKPTEGAMTIGRGNDGSDVDIDFTGGPLGAPDGVPDPVGDGLGWFLDPTPQEHSEFLGTINNAFSAAAPAFLPDGITPNPIASQADLYAVVLHEVGHALGFSSSNQLLLRSGGRSTLTNAGGNPDADTDAASINSPTGQPSTNPGFLWRFDGPSIRHLLTSYNSANANGQTLGTDSGGPGHSAAAGQTVTDNGITYVGADDLMNPRYGFGQRRLIAETTALILQDAYNYRINRPANWPNFAVENSGVAAYGTSFYATLRNSDGRLLIRGGAANDVITVETVGSSLFVSVDIGNDVPGTGSLPGAGNLPAFSAYFPSLAAVNHIVIQAGDGNDTININLGAYGNANSTKSLTINGDSDADTISIEALPRGITATINAGFGHDDIFFSRDGGFLNNIQSSVTIEGGAFTNVDSLYLNDRTNANRNRTYTLTASTVQLPGGNSTITYSNLGSLFLTTGSAEDATVNVHANYVSVRTIIDGAAIVNLGRPLPGSSGKVTSFIEGSLQISNLSRATALTIDDSAETSTSRTVGILSNSVHGFTNIPISFTFAFLSSLTVHAGSAGNTFFVQDTRVVAETRSITLNTGRGADTVHVQRTKTPLTVNGQNGFDTVNVGLGGSARSIGGELIVTNIGSYSAVNVDNSADTVARTVILYKNGVFNRISGLIPVGDIVLRGRDLSSLLVRAGSGGNAYRIHDTPTSNTAGGLTTTIHTGAGSDQVTVNRTSGALALHAQDGANSITVGSATAGLNAINAPIHVSALGLSNTLFVVDGASTTARDYVVGRDFVQRLDKARISFQNLSNLNLGTGTLTDHVVVEDTNPTAGSGFGTSIYTGAAGDRIDVRRTTGTLLVNAGGASVIEVGDALNALDSIQGFISVTPVGAGNYVTLSLNDQAATTPQQLDVAPHILGTSFLRSGAAEINVFFSPLATFRWTGGSGGNIVNVKAQPAAGSIFVMGDGGDVINVGTAADKLFANGILNVIGGVGTDQLLIRDQGTTAPRRYDLGLGALSARPLNSVSNVMNVRFDHVEAVTLNGGSGGNFFKITGAPAAASLLINAGAGTDTIDVGSNAVYGSCGDGDYDNCNPPLLTPADSLVDVRGRLTLDGQGGADGVIVRDNGDPNARNYTLSPTTLVRSDAPAAPIFYANVETLALKGSAGDNVFALTSTAFAPAISIDGGGGVNTLDYSALPTASNFSLVARYSGEGNADDTVAGNHGTLVNNVAFAPGRVGQAFSFDGDNAYVQVPNSPRLEAPTISVEAWVSASDPGTNAYVLAKGASGITAASYALYTGTSGGLFFYIFDGETYVESPDAGPSIWDGNWHHVVGTFDGSTVRLYVDGLEIGVGTPTAVQIGYNLPSTNDLFIGTYQSDLSLSFRGVIDEPAVYNRALSGAEIRALNPVSRYTGEGNAADSAGNNHGTIQGNVTFVPGQVGQAFDFDGLDGVLDYIDLGSDASLDLPGSMSVSMWVRLESLDHAKYFLADFNSSGNVTQGSLGTVEDKSVFAWVQSYEDQAYETLAGTTPIQLNQWFHLAVVRDDAAKIVRLYVNGVEESSLSYVGKTVVRLQSSKVLGGSIQNFPADYIDGQLDEVGIYNRTLSFAEIQALYSGASAGGVNGVVVNLPLGTASGLMGGIAGIQNVVGSEGDDILVGNGGNVLTGGPGRDLLIAGTSASTLDGGDGEDLLIAGTTVYDTNAAALLAIMAQWKRTDEDYATRAANLQNGTNGVPILNATTVRANGSVNTLRGGTGLDFYFANLDLDTLDRDALLEELVEIRFTAP